MLQKGQLCDFHLNVRMPYSMKTERLLYVHGRDISGHWPVLALRSGVFKRTLLEGGDDNMENLQRLLEATEQLDPPANNRINREIVSLSSPIKSLKIRMIHKCSLLNCVVIEMVSSEKL